MGSINLSETEPCWIHASHRGFLRGGTFSLELGTSYKRTSSEAGMLLKPALRGVVTTVPGTGGCLRNGGPPLSLSKLTSEAVGERL